MPKEKSNLVFRAEVNTFAKNHKIMTQSKNISKYSLAVAAFLTLALFVSYRSGDFGGSDARFDSLTQVVRSVNINQSYDLAGEPIPMDNFDVVERLDRELIANSYLHGSTILNIKLAHRYFPFMEKILADNNIPDDMKYLAVIESNLRNATSPAGAKGIWQFMEGTARQYSLEVSAEVDERYHIEKCSRAFCSFIKDCKQKFGSWTLAAAAYNGGPGRISGELANQRAANFYQLNLTEETMRYPFRIVAMKEIMKNPRFYGYFVKDEGLYKVLDDFTEVVVTGKVDNWGDFAKQYGTDFRTLKIYNPWLIGSSLMNKMGKSYTIKIPKKS